MSKHDRDSDDTTDDVRNSIKKMKLDEKNNYHQNQQQHCRDNKNDNCNDNNDSKRNYSCVILDDIENSYRNYRRRSDNYNISSSTCSRSSNQEQLYSNDNNDNNNNYNKSKLYDIDIINDINKQQYNNNPQMNDELQSMMSDSYRKLREMNIYLGYLHHEKLQRLEIKNQATSNMTTNELNVKSSYELCRRSGTNSSDNTVINGHIFDNNNISHDMTNEFNDEAMDI